MTLKKIDSSWLYFDTLKVWQAAALIEGCDPNFIELKDNEIINLEEKLTEKEFTCIKTIFSALIQSIKSGKLDATIIRDGRLGREFENYSDAVESWDVRKMSGERLFYKKSPNWEKTTISVDSLKKWLQKGQVKPEFFFPTNADNISPEIMQDNKPDYLNKNQPRYSRKLAATIGAWQAVTNPKKRSPKEALDIWLRAHAGDFGMTNAEGQPVEQAMKDCSKVANWNYHGGANRAEG